MGLLNFDATNVAPDQGRDYTPVPAGDYVLIIESTEVLMNKKGTGHNLELVHQIADGEFKGRKIFDRITLSNRTSPEAERIGQGQLSALCHAVGVLKVADSAQLHDKAYLATLKITPAKDGYSAKNEITKRASLGIAKAIPAAAVVAQAPVQAHVAAAPPWARK